MSKQRLVRAAAVIALACTAPALGQADDAYPTRPVRLVVGYGAGGSVDIPARYIADKLGTILGQRVIVENKSGAAGMIAARDVVSQPRDGYNLLLCSHFEPINTLLYRTVSYKLTDIAPISLITTYYYGLAVPNSTPADTVDQFVQYARSHPGALNFAAIGSGSAQEIFARQLERLAGITMTMIPFRGGPQIAQELIAGRVDLYVAPTLAVMSLYESKQIKILAMSSPERLAAAPAVPTLREEGLDFVRFGWLGICAAAGTPQPIIELLNRHIAAIVASPGYRALIESGGQIARSSTPGELAKIIAETIDTTAPTIKEFGMQQD